MYSTIQHDDVMGGLGRVGGAQKRMGMHIFNPLSLKKQFPFSGPHAMPTR